MERELLMGLTGLYQDLEESEIEELSEGEKRNIEGFKRSERKVGRSLTLESLYDNYKKFEGRYENLDEETVKLTIERYEIIDLQENGKFKLATIRGGSLLQSLLRNKLDRPDLDFSSASEKAYADDIISKKDQKSLDYIWEVRSDVAHSYWTDTELDIYYYTVAVHFILIHLYKEIESRIEDDELKEKVLPASVKDGDLEGLEGSLDTILQYVRADLGHSYSEKGWNI